LSGRGRRPAPHTVRRARFLAQRADASILLVKTSHLRLLALGAVLIAPLRILTQGYLPGDDALRHVGKAIAGRPWTDILLLRPDITLDSNPGWHAILGALHRWLGLGANDLLVFSVVALFVIFSLGAVLLLRRPETWLIALALLCVADSHYIERLLHGRPFLLSSAIVPVVCLLWPRLESHRPYAVLALFAACGALSTWIHGSYYLLALPVAAVLVAGRWKAGVRLAAAFAVGILLGALLTGHPIGHLWQMLLHGYLAVGLPRPATALVAEFQPFDGRAVAAAGLLALLAWRLRRDGVDTEPWRDPTAVLAVGGWALGFVAYRFWGDWGAPALMTLAAVEMQSWLERPHAPWRPPAPLAIAAGAVALLLLVSGADLNRRWSDQAGRPFLVRENPTHAAWLPEPGGIAYSSELYVFYHLFFKNPDAPWKYVLGFEPAIMRSEDYAVYCDVKRTWGAATAYMPWVRRMQPQDRLYVERRSTEPPSIPELEWSHPVSTIWAGRLPRANTLSMPATAGAPQPQSLQH
jgi:hypothetical protein